MKQEIPPNKVDQYTLWWKNKPAETPKRKRKKIFISRLISKQS